MSDKKDILLKKAIGRILETDSRLSLGYFKHYLTEGGCVVVATKDRAKQRWGVTSDLPFAVFRTSPLDDERATGPLETFSDKQTAIDTFIVLVDADE